MNPTNHPVCPVCKTPLRLRPGSKVSLEIPCPECGALLAIEPRDEGARVSRKSADPVAPAARLAKPLRIRWTTPVWLPRVGGRVGEWLREPLVLTWLAAGVAAIVLGIAFYRAGTTPMVADIAERERDFLVDERPIDAGPGPVRDPREVVAAVIAPRPFPNFENNARTAPLPPEVPPRSPVRAVRPDAREIVDQRARAKAGLSQRIVRFEQAGPISFEAIRGELAEMAGVPIRYAAGIGPVESEVSLNVSDVTLAEVLRRLSRQAGLSYRIDFQGVVLEPIEDRRDVGLNSR